MADRPPPDDEYARQSSDSRRIRPWQYWTLAIVIILVLLVVFLWPTYDTTPPPGETVSPAGEVEPPAAETAPEGGEPAPPGDAQ